MVPLANAKSFGGPPSEALKPIFKIGGERCILLTPMLAGIRSRAASFTPVAARSRIDVHDEAPPYLPGK